MKRLITICLLLLFAANAHAASTLIYDPGGFESSIEQAMINLGIAYDLRNAANPVTAGDLATHDILIAGWNAGGDASGLSAAVLGAGITGNILLSGHDADFHVVHGPTAPASTFLTQAIDFVKAAGGTSFLALGDTYGFSYLPAGWGVSATVAGGETVTAFTAAGLASGVYDGLTTFDMSGWGVSFHDYFEGGFVPFELSGDNVITVARIIPAPGAILLGGIGVSLVGWLRRRRSL